MPPDAKPGIGPEITGGGAVSSSFKDISMGTFGPDTNSALQNMSGWDGGKMPSPVQTEAGLIVPKSAAETALPGNIGDMASVMEEGSRDPIITPANNPNRAQGGSESGAGIDPTLIVDNDQGISIPPEIATDTTGNTAPTAPKTPVPPVPPPTEAGQSTPGELGSTQTVTDKQARDKAFAEMREPQGPPTTPVETANLKMPDDIKLIDAKAKRGEALTKEETKKLNDHKKKENFAEKARKGELSDAEIEEHFNNEADAAKGEKTRDQALKDATDALAELQKRGDKMTPEERIAAMTTIREAQKTMNGITEEEAGRAVAEETIKVMMDPEYAKSKGLSPEQTQRQKEMQEKIMALVRLEAQLIVLPDRLEALIDSKTQKINEIKKEERSFKDDADPAVRQRYYARYMELNNIQANIDYTRNTAGIWEAKYNDDMQWIRRKLGVTHGLQAFFEFAGSKMGMVNRKLAHLAQMDVNAFDGGGQGLLGYVSPRG